MFTSSPASEDGPTPLTSPDGRGSGRSGRGAVPASRSAPRANGEAPKTSGTCGRSSADSSRAASLQSWLESRLPLRLAGSGSPLYGLTWRNWDMKSGPRIFALRASARRTSDSDSGSGQCGWPTATTRDSKDGARCDAVPENGLLGRVVWQAGWPTATQGDAASSGRHTTTTGVMHSGTTLTDAARTAGWPTPMAGSPGKPGRYNPAGNNDSSRRTVQLCGWTTDAGPARFTADGRMLTGCSAVMVGGGRLNPAHSRWLMGYPPVWDDCGATAMRSFRRSPRRSSRR